MLTLAAYFAVVSNFPNALLIIFVLAVIQLFVQMVFFLHLLSKSSDRNYNLAVLTSTVSIILIVVIGSLWIMRHLNYNMTPDQMNDYMLKTEGVGK